MFLRREPHLRDGLGHPTDASLGADGPYGGAWGLHFHKRERSGRSSSKTRLAKGSAHRGTPYGPQRASQGCCAPRVLWVLMLPWVPPRHPTHHLSGQCALGPIPNACSTSGPSPKQSTRTPSGARCAAWRRRSPVWPKFACGCGAQPTAEEDEGIARGACPALRNSVRVHLGRRRMRPARAGASRSRSSDVYCNASLCCSEQQSVVRPTHRNCNM